MSESMNEIRERIKKKRINERMDEWIENGVNEWRMNDWLTGKNELMNKINKWINE